MKDGMTVATRARIIAGPRPQWSPPMKDGMTRPWIGPDGTALASPQWSPPMKDGMTHFACDRTLCVN